jgi:hypothetical protein
MYSKVVQVSLLDVCISTNNFSRHLLKILLMTAKKTKKKTFFFWKSAYFFLIDAPEFESAWLNLRKKIIFGHFNQLSIFW